MARTGVIERWKPVPGHGGIFVASSFGRIARVVGYAGADGYQQISFKRAHLAFKAHSTGRRQPDTLQGYAHHLVALAFHGEPPEGKTEVNHKDFDRGNNRPRNLEWATHAENLDHWRRLRGDASYAARKPWKYSTTIWSQVRALATQGFSHRAIAAQLSMSPSGVRWILSSKKYLEAA